MTCVCAAEAVLGRASSKPVLAHSEWPVRFKNRLRLLSKGVDTDRPVTEFYLTVTFLLHYRERMVYADTCSKVINPAGLTKEPILFKAP